MKWHEVSVQIREEAQEAVSQYLHDLGASGVSIEQSWQLLKQRRSPLDEWYDVDHPFNDIPEGDVLIKAYFAIANEDEAGETGSDHGSKAAITVMDQLKRFVDQLGGWGIDAGKPTFSERTVHEQDWSEAWKKYYKPVRVTDRLIVKPTWEDYESKPGEHIVELDPGMAFGTGTHATTTLCMRMLERYVERGDEVIDVGTGSGILSISAARLGAAGVLAVDLDPVAVSSAQSNVELNGLADRITVTKSDLLGVLQAEQTKADASPLPVKLPVRIVVANILADIIMRFVSDVAQALMPGGIYIASGIIDSKAEEVEAELKRHGFTIADRLREDGWVALAARKQAASV